MINTGRVNLANIRRGAYSVFNWIPYHAHFFTPYPVGSFIINISRECEMRCMMCNIWQNRKTEYAGKSLDAETLSAMLNNSAFLKKMPYVVMTGGEPFLRKDFGEILKSVLLVPHIRKVTIGTSGFLTRKIVSDVNACLEATDRAKKIALQISLQGVGEVQDRIKGRADAFSRLKKTINELKALSMKYPGRLTLYIYSVLQEQNKDTFEKTYEFSREQGIGYTFGIINNLSYNMNSSEQYTKELINEGDFKRLSDLYPFYGVLKNWARKGFTQQSTGLRCFAGYSSFFLDFDGSVYPCLHTSSLKSFRMGNVFEESFDGIWKKAKKARALTKTCAIDECLQGCDRSVVKLQYYVPEMVCRAATLNRYSLLKARGIL
ncbi:MAG: radical SAM protein [Deltaproteobacteria bacterium]|nr:radical SAM protein [Deltaproteobacteria bacterium]